MRRKITFILMLLVSILALSSCGFLQSDTKTPAKAVDNTQITSPENNNIALQENTNKDPEMTIEERAMEVLKSIRDFDMEKLAQAIHPEKGVRFSPYAFVDVEKDLVFTADEVKMLASDTKTYIWGHYDGSGDPIGLTFREYYKDFIYDVDFLNAEQISVNEPLGQGNTVNNSFEVYKESKIVEFYFSCIDPKYEGMDWRSLRLVFEKKDGSWYLVGIIHDEWTI